MSKTYEQSRVYRQGCFYFELGLLLIDSQTSNDQIVELATHYGLDYDLVFRLIPPRAPGNQEATEAEKERT